MSSATLSGETAPRRWARGRRRTARRPRARLWWALLTPVLAYLLVFFLAPLYQMVRFSLGLSHLSRTDAIARLRGEELSFTLSFWKTMVGNHVVLHVLGARVGMPLLVFAIALLVLLGAALFGHRLPRHGGWVTTAGLLVIVALFFTIPAGTHLWRVAQLRSNSLYLDLFFKSVSMAMTTAVFATVLALPVAYYLAFCAGRSRYTWLLVVIAPFFTSFFLRIIAWKVILGSSGLINTLLESVGLVSRAHPLSFLLYSQFTVIVVLIYAWMPFACLPMFVALENVDRGLQEAAADMGASRRRIFTRVTLPLAAPGLVAGFLFVFIPTIGEFVTPSLVGGTQGFMFGNEISDLLTVDIDWQTGATLAIFLLLVVLALTASTSRWLRGQEAR